MAFYFLPDQMCIQHHVVRFPIHLCRLDLTIRGRTWDPHEVLLEDDPMLLCDPMCLWTAKIKVITIEI